MDRLEAPNRTKKWTMPEIVQNKKNRVKKGKKDENKEFRDIRPSKKKGKNEYRYIQDLGITRYNMIIKIRKCHHILQLFKHSKA